MKPTSDERREVAERLIKTRGIMAFVDALGIDIDSDWSWADVSKRVAELIDPTCRDMGGSVPGVSALECSRCGALLNVGDGGGLRVAGHYYDDTPNASISYCPYCGARIIR